MGFAQGTAEDALEIPMHPSADRYVALLTAVPIDIAGTGLIEASGSGYARILNTSWTNAVVNDVVERSNSVAVTFAALTDDLDGIVGWALYDALTSGTLQAFGTLKDGSGNDTTQNFVATDQPRFAIGELKLTLENCT